MLRFARNFDFDLIYNKDSFQNNLWGNSLPEYYASNNSSSWVPFIPLGPISGKVFQWLEMSWRLLINCYEDIYEKGYLWRDTNIHHEYFSIVYNNWILGEPDKPDKCHYSQWFSYTRETSLGNQVKKTIYTLVITDLSSPLFVGIPKKTCESFFGERVSFFPAKPPIIEVLFLMIGAEEAKCLLLSLSGGSARAIRARRWDQWDLLAPTL